MVWCSLFCSPDFRTPWLHGAHRSSACLGKSYRSGAVTKPPSVTSPAISSHAQKGLRNNACLAEQTVRGCVYPAAILPTHRSGGGYRTLLVMLAESNRDASRLRQQPPPPSPLSPFDYTFAHVVRGLLTHWVHPPQVFRAIPREVLARDPKVKKAAKSAANKLRHQSSQKRRDKRTPRAESGSGEQAQSQVGHSVVPEEDDERESSMAVTAESPAPSSVAAPTAE